MGATKRRVTPIIIRRACTDIVLVHAEFNYRARASWSGRAHYKLGCSYLQRYSFAFCSRFHHFIQKRNKEAMKGLIIAIVFAAAVSVAAGQNVTQGCSQKDLDELNRLITKVNECDPCEVEDPEDCKCCALYRSAVALQELCKGSDNNQDVRRDVIILSNNHVSLKDICNRALFKSSGSAMIAGVTMMVVAFIATTMF